LLGAVAVVALALASLLQPWRSWCPALVSTGVLVLMLLSIPCCIYARERTRTFCVGFSIVGWGYFLFVYAPWFKTSVGHQLLARPIAESGCYLTTGSLGDFPVLPQAIHALFMFLLAYLGGLTACWCSIHVPSCNGS